jgi:hypothetical protein
MNRLGECFYNFLHWHTNTTLAIECSIVGSIILRIVTMSEHDVDIWRLESSKRALEAFDDVLLGQAPACC